MTLWKGALLALSMIAVSPAWAGEAAQDTASQHHEWARKFAPTVSSADALGIPSLAEPATEPAPGTCERTELVFGRMPVQRWRIGTCV
ncbi:MAG TPA: hypothetical protein VGU24_14795 [Microvirga sp.]|jgi:hypothetical protein|nr:hypothetical protein [Microvirga sp.]